MSLKEIEFLGRNNFFSFALLNFDFWLCLCFPWKFLSELIDDFGS